MSFIYDNTPLHNWPKESFNTRPDILPTQKISGPDWNELAQALTDVQSFLRGAPWVVMTGSTPGAASSESVELLYGTSAFQLADGQACLIELDVAAGGVQGVTRVCAAWKQRLLVRRAAGVTVVADSGAVDFMKETGSTDWLFAVAIGTTPDRVKLTFTTGATHSICQVSARLTPTEVTF